MDMDNKPFSVFSHPVYGASNISETKKNLPFYFFQLGRSIYEKTRCAYYPSAPCYTILLTIEGSCSFIYRGKKILISPGDITFYDNKDIQYFDVDTSNNWDYLWINFYGNSAEMLFDYCISSGIYSAPCKNPEKAREIFYKIAKINESPSVYNDIETSLLIHTLIFEAICSISDNSQLLTNSPPWAAESIKIIKDSYNTPISISGLAKKFGISESHFVRGFKKSTGLNPYSYIIHYRIIKAKKMLLSEDKTIDEIAAAVGFNNTSNFIRKFKESEGITPGNFRKFNS